MNSAGMVMVFVRNPEPGAVKTRLERDIAATAGAGKARVLTLALYEAFVLDTVDGVRRSLGRERGLRVCFDPPTAAASVRRWLGDDLEYAPQHGKDLGARMAHAFEQAWRSTDRAVLMGSDAPDYPPELIAHGLDSLDEADAVIAPSLDGGYFLIGFRRAAYHPDFFRGLAWGGSSVCETTLAKLGDAGVKVDILPEWNDIDRGGDALAVLRMHQGDDFAGSRTYALLDAHRDVFEVFDIDTPESAGGVSLRQKLTRAREGLRERIRMFHDLDRNRVE